MKCISEFNIKIETFKIIGVSPERVKFLLVPCDFIITFVFSKLYPTKSICFFSNEREIFLDGIIKCLEAVLVLV